VRRALTAAICLSLSSIPASPAQDGSARVVERLSRTATARIEADDVAGAVVVLLREGMPVWTGAFGMADPERGVPLTRDALFRVESLSKPVTAWAAMLVAETGRLDLDAPAKDCLRRWRPPEGTPDFTARHLLSHVAGVGLGDFADRHAPGSERPGLPDHLDRDFEMIAASGGRFAYSDTGYTLLELMIEDCAGEDFAALVTRGLFEPLGMQTATYVWPGPDMPLGHGLRGRPVAPYVYPGRGSGGLFATADDMARLAAAGMAGADQPVLSEAAVESLHDTVVAVEGLFGFAADGYALGHFTETLSDGRHAVWHGGQGHGWMSHMHLVPETGDGIVILSNSQRAWPLFAALLRDWSESLGVAPVGMTRVLWARRAAHVGIALGPLVGAFGVWMARRPGPRSGGARVAAGGLGAALVLWPLWAASRDYLFLFSILTGLWPWLGATSGLAGFGVVAFAILPARRR
jgi:CubicO group peptidase (beta-lactamase class C family)